MREDVQQMVAEKLGGDYYILPSSVHETLILPKSENMSFSEIADYGTGCQCNVCFRGRSIV